jgi:hypothetical protein
MKIFPINEIEYKLKSYIDNNLENLEYLDSGEVISYDVVDEYEEDFKINLKKLSEYLQTLPDHAFYYKNIVIYHVRPSYGRAEQIWIENY